MNKTTLQKKSLFKNIVVGVDFSEYSKIVVKQALQLAKQMNAKLVMVHATVDPTWESASAGVYIPPVSLREVQKSLQRFYHVEPSETVTFQVKRGYASEVVIGVADQMQNSLIVVGSQGRGAISNFILGSHAEEIALRSKKPVWVHRGQKIVPFKKVLVPIDLSNSSKKLMTQMKKWSVQMKMSMSYIYVRPEINPILNSFDYKQMKSKIQNAINRSVELFRKNQKNTLLTVIKANDPSEKISQIGKKYDVITMNPHTRSGLLNKFGRITSRVIRLSENPILVIKS